MFSKLIPNRNSLLGTAIRKWAFRNVQTLVFGKSLIRKEGAQFASSAEIGQFLSRQNKGLLLNGRDLRLSTRVSQQNVAVYGITGKGKSTVLARPAILDKAKTDSVLIVNDMSGDLYAETSGYMAANGYRVIVLNPNDLEHSNRFNPFLGLDNSAAVMRISDLLSKNAGSDREAEFWSSGGERYIRFFIKCLATMPEVFNAPHNLYHVMANFGVDGEELDEWVASCAGDNVFLKNEWKALTVGADETITSFIINGLVALKIFSEPHVCALTASSDFDLASLRRQKTIIYLITPPEDQDIYRPLISMYFLRFIHQAMLRLPTSEDLPLICIFDEFGNSFVPGFDKLITTTRKYDISFLLMMQGQNQLVTNYGQKMMPVILSGVGTHVSFGAAEDETAKYFERRAGKVRTFYRNEDRDTHVEHHSEYSLISASEIRELPDNKLLVISDNRKTTLLDVYPSHESARWRHKMNYSPAPIYAKAEDRLVFIPL